MTAPTEENNASTNSSQPSVIVETKESALVERLHGLLESKGYGPTLRVNIYDFLKAVEKFASIQKATAIVTFKQGNRRRFLTLHKKTSTISIILLCEPTNNNTHAPEEKAVTP